MLKNYFKTALRNIFRNKTFSLITILGLAVGLTCSMLILIFVVDEISYDKFHSNSSKIYRLRYKIQDFDIARVPPVFKEHLNDFFPEIEESARLFSRSVSVIVPKSGGDEKRFEQGNVNFTDPEIFRIFDFELVSGDLHMALEEPFTVVLNEEIAANYFDGQNAVGRSIIMEGDQDFKVVAVVKDFPSNSHTHFDMLVPYDNMYDLEPESIREAVRQNFQQNWMVSHSVTYVSLRQDADPQAVNDRFPNFVDEKIPEQMKKGQAFELQALQDIHLNDDVQAQAEASGSYSFIYIFMAVGILTLLIASINFINLSTVKSLSRGKEIGMRKVLGAWRSNLVFQFLGESIITTVMAAILSFLFTSLLLPEMNVLTNKELEMSTFYQTEVILGFVGIVLLTSILAGIYPAFFVSGFSPLTSLKGKVSSGKGSLALRKGLIMTQFVISIVLISSSIIVFDQLDMLRNKPLGFKKELMITVPLQSANFNSVFGGVDADKRKKMNAFEEAIAQIPGVVNSTVSSSAPGFGMVNRNVIPEGFTVEDNMLSAVMAVDYDFMETYEIEVISGRSFSLDYSTDNQSAFMINEMAVEDFNFGNLTEAIGKEINLEGKQGNVVGVVSDFNFLPLTEPMRPLIIEISVPQFSVFSIRLGNQNVASSLEKIEGIWNDYFPNETFDHSFLDQNLADSYETQQQFGTLIGYFAFLAIFISCLGSYGVIMYIASQRRKEIGVRKVLGASIPQIVLLLSKRFIVLVIISVFIAIPITYFAADYWLDDFSYRVDISPVSIVIASMATLALVLLTVSQQSIKAAMVNPAKTLKEE